MKDTPTYDHPSVACQVIQRHHPAMSRRPSSSEFAKRETFSGYRVLVSRLVEQ